MNCYMPTRYAIQLITIKSDNLLIICSLYTFIIIFYKIVSELKSEVMRHEFPLCRYSRLCCISRICYWGSAVCCLVRCPMFFCTCWELPQDLKKKGSENVYFLMFNSSGSSQHVSSSCRTTHGKTLQLIGGPTGISLYKFYTK